MKLRACRNCGGRPIRVNGRVGYYYAFCNGTEFTNPCGEYARSRRSRAERDFKWNAANAPKRAKVKR